MARNIKFVKDKTYTKILIDGRKRGYYWKAYYGEYVVRLDYWSRNKKFKTESGLRKAVIREANKYSSKIDVRNIIGG